MEIMENPKMLRLRILTLVAIWMALVAPSFPAAQEPAEEPDLTIDSALRNQVVEGVIRHLKEAYVFPEVADKMGEALQVRLQHGEYDGVSSAKRFAEILTEHLQEVSRDKHLRVGYRHHPFPSGTDGDAPSPQERERRRRELRAINFGFEKAERLEGNIGYLDLRGFLPAALGAETAVAAMNFLANTDAIIFDLRKNGGGDPAMVALISSYLFDPEPVHLNSLYWRPTDFSHQWWTLPYVPGQRLGTDKEVYVLTSSYTFSAAEEFTYNLKSLKRATIIGETTGGGAHPGGTRPVHPNFVVWVPSGRAINPITQTNWEGTGVRPDVAVSADEALGEAHLRAVKAIEERTGDPQRKAQLGRLIHKLEQQRNQPGKSGDGAKSGKE
jgi:retinol-binding protein 3